MSHLTTPVYGTLTGVYQNTPSQRVRSKNWGGRVRVLTDTYMASALAAGSQILLGRVPAGATVIAGEIQWEALGSNTSILGVGDQYNCTRFMTRATTVLASQTQRTASPATVAFFPDCGRFNSLLTKDTTVTPARAETGLGYEYTCEQDIILYLDYSLNGAAGSASGTRTGAFTWRLEYVTE